MKIDEKKLQRQHQVITKWRNHKGVGIFEAVTGFGKTYVAILLIKSLNEVHPGQRTIVVVPTTKIFNDWVRVAPNKEGSFGHIKEYGLNDVQVFVINTYVKEIWSCLLLIADEVHHYANEDSMFFSTMIKITSFTYMLGLTATLNDKERRFLESYNVPVIDQITEIEAEREGYIVPSIVYNLAVDLAPEEEEIYTTIHDTFNTQFAKFEHNFRLATACKVGNDSNAYVFFSTITGNLCSDSNPNARKEWMTGRAWREWWAERQDWNGHRDHYWSPENISKYAWQWGHAMSQRMNYLYNLPGKLDVAARIIEKLDAQTIVFSESKDFAEKLRDKIELASPGTALLYHSSLPSEVRFEDKLIGHGVKVKIGSGKEKTFYKYLETDEVMEWNEFKTRFPFGQRLGGNKLKEQVISRFEAPGSSYRVLCTVRALDEGFNVENIRLAIQCAYSSTKRQDVQRKGRSQRIDYEDMSKVAIIVNLYARLSDPEKTSQEERWLKRKQKGQLQRKIKWIDSIDQISIERQTININYDG